MEARVYSIGKFPRGPLKARPRKPGVVVPIRMDEREWAERIQIERDARHWVDQIEINFRRLRHIVGHIDAMFKVAERLENITPPKGAAS